MRLSEKIFPGAGLAGLDLLADLMTQEAQSEAGRGLEYSQSWRPDIGSERMRDDRDHLVSAVRDSAAALVEGGTRLDDVVGALERPELEITRRIAIDLLAGTPRPRRREIPPRSRDFETGPTARVHEAC